MNYQTGPITMWFDRRLVVRTSPIHGIGTFATHDIDAGELLRLVAGGLVITAEARHTDTLQLASRMYNQEKLAEDVFVLTPKLFQYYINHSCDPNAVDITRRANSTQYVALRDIRADEEITADYYDETVLAICLCKSPRC
ncbi:MAG TPA: SET domain-containing protein-lysine N-methyltransferase [Anaerolineales bacterium]|nr:SET domain-containing protein-lysine N-methyltransferase [Anaerolineales bacterium]